MQDFIIIAIILVIAGFGLRASITHFKGQGGCCGGGDCRPKKKKLSHVKYQKTFHVEGIHCKRCKYRVEEAVNDLPGVAGKVNLKQNLLTVSYEMDVPDETIAAQIKRAGYRVV